ncbi:hypothetical protein LTR78_004103 [Recurvomyces mirabilis]|uniref:Uncharacterized protein n=1 Tax=Recurvomyces mirabilis TaxID=574656 RepID=A0AAE1C2P9_9PEZI|nr:hypothetical protein LTR78_004103 [Recurvomyces mirabilis]KAK5153724.1 hypothetical protein LTS14_007418 [Recurvomyces mirabilis]
MAASRTVPAHDPLRMLDLAASDGQRVRNNQPPTSDSNGMDYVRCTVLHNAIVKYGWRASGQHVTEMPMTTWWEAAYDLSLLDQAQQQLDLSVVEFLKRAMMVPSFSDSTDNNFFHFSPDLRSADTDEKLVPLYMANYHEDD